MKDNTIGIIVVGLIAFLAIIVTGKWLLDKKDNHHERRYEHRRVVEVRPQTPAPQQNITVPVYPQYHNSNDFWMGYNDGWNRLPSRMACPEYVQGYEIGRRDWRLGRHEYYDRHCPPGFSLRVPGFRLNIR